LPCPVLLGQRGWYDRFPTRIDGSTISAGTPPRRLRRSVPAPARGSPFQERWRQRGPRSPALARRWPNSLRCVGELVATQDRRQLAGTRAGAATADTAVVSDVRQRRDLVLGAPRDWAAERRCVSLGSIGDPPAAPVVPGTCRECGSKKRSQKTGKSPACADYLARADEGNPRIQLGKLSGRF
jgi:hypothetical protein